LVMGVYFKKNGVYKERCCQGEYSIPPSSVIWAGTGVPLREYIYKRILSS
jgi:hypothetical protein